MADQKQKRSSRPTRPRGPVNRFTIPEFKEAKGKNRTNAEDQAILAANQNDSDWLFDEAKDEYSLILNGHTVMKIPTKMYQRLKPFQRDAVKWIAHVGLIGAVLADDMGMGT